MTVPEIARATGLTPTVSSKRRKRFADYGMSGLSDMAGRGGPKAHGAESRADVLARLPPRTNATGQHAFSLPLPPIEAKEAKPFRWTHAGEPLVVHGMCLFFWTKREWSFWAVGVFFAKGAVKKKSSHGEMPLFPKERHGGLATLLRI